MSVKYGLLALLGTGPSHGYELKTAFEQHTGGVWQLNIGQVYTTLQRLERDGLVASAGADGERQLYRLTPAGRVALDEWFATPVAAASPPPRDELAIKVLIGIAAGDVEVEDVIQRQRAGAIGQLQEYTRLKALADPHTDLAWVLLLDSLIFKIEAEVRWLNACEARLRQRLASGRAEG